MLYLWVARVPQCESLHLLETAPVICPFRLLLKEAIEALPERLSGHRRNHLGMGYFS